MPKGHDSDCGLHNEPAFPNEDCDCSVSTKTIEISEDFLEHLLACLANQKFINSINADALTGDYKKTQKNIQKTIDKGYLDGWNLLKETLDDDDDEE